MKAERVTLRLGKTIPGPEYGGGQYANVKPEIEITVLLEPGETPTTALDALTPYCIKKIEEIKAALIGEQVKIKPTNGAAPQPMGYQPPQAPPYQPAPLVAAPQPPPPPMSHGQVMPAITKPNW